MGLLLGNLNGRSSDPDAVLSQMHRKLFARKECWVPTTRGWALLLGIAFGFLASIACTVDSFLAVNKPVAADVLVVEGWLPDSSYSAVLQEFRRGSYKYVITTGLTLPEGWQSSPVYQSAAELAAANLAASGLPTNVVVALPAALDARDRTYYSALAVGQWLKARRHPLMAVNIYSLGPHARRTRLLYQKALGRDVKVGIFAGPDDSYDPKHWWSSSYGFRKIVGETFAYAYARVLFHPFGNS